MQDEARRQCLSPGSNCWTTAVADRAAVIVDAEDYFRELVDAFEAAQRSILIIGWDFDGAIPLRPDQPEGRQVVLGPFLRDLVERKPDLEVRILVWSLSIFHGPGAPLPLLIGEEWQNHPRIKLKLDTEHPVYASHHQKIVSIDDHIAYTGGIDLTVKRWDSVAHHAEDDRRRAHDGDAYGPVHDVQMRVEGEAAICVSEIARERWLVATGEDHARCGGVEPRRVGLETHFENMPVAVVRTSPAWKRKTARREGAALTRDIIESADRFLYVEAQYLTSRYVERLFAGRLMEPRGPEIVIVLRAEAEGYFERRYMAENRDRLLRRLKKSDRYDRLRVYSPVVRHGDGRQHILVHAKVMIADDDILRIGSSNLNNRSIGLDSECDLALEADAESARQAIAAVRWRLLAEHLGAEPQTIAEAFARRGSLIGVIDDLNGAHRSLEAFPALTTPGPTRQVWGTRLFDPIRPYRLLSPLMRPLARLMRPRRGGGGTSAR